MTRLGRFLDALDRAWQRAGRGDNLEEVEKDLRRDLDEATKPEIPRESWEAWSKEMFGGEER